MSRDLDRAPVVPYVLDCPAQKVSNTSRSNVISFSPKVTVTSSTSNKSCCPSDAFPSHSPPIASSSPSNSQIGPPSSSSSSLIIDADVVLLACARSCSVSASALSRTSCASACAIIELSLYASPGVTPLPALSSPKPLLASAVAPTSASRMKARVMASLPPLEVKGGSERGRKESERRRCVDSGSTMPHCTMIIWISFFVSPIGSCVMMARNIRTGSSPSAEWTSGR
mmetsp:Transcript_3013/g.7065  ORF Transcript_3013/g.7065 Transcript_3013/m.7065 type:complete len:227 (+) Transcript_3013:1224-1904(+)